MQQTLAILKPDVTRTGYSGILLEQILLAGFSILDGTLVKLSVEQAEEFYAEHKGKDFYQGLIDFMTSGLCWMLILEKEDGVKAWRELIGSSDPEVDRAKRLNTIRAVYGKNQPHNAVHGSDSPKSADREIILFQKWFNR